jgi:hypothetical protein
LGTETLKEQAIAVEKPRLPEGEQIVMDTREDVSDSLVKSDNQGLADKLKADFAESAEIKMMPVPEKKGMDLIEIKVKDKERWASEGELRKLMDPFGEVVFNAYKDREDPTVYNKNDPDFMEKCFQDNMVGTDLSFSDTIYAMAEKGVIQGFVSFRDLQVEGMKASELMLLATHPNQKGTSLGSKIREMAFTMIDSDAIAGVSHTPSSIKGANKLTKKMGWRNYFCGYKNGDQNIPLTSEETEEVKKVEDAIKLGVKNDDTIGGLQEGIPDHYVSYGQFGIPPRKLKELKFNKDDSLQKTFEDLIGWEEKNRPGDCIYGIEVTLRSQLKK